jgi:hypothetical protein
VVHGRHDRLFAVVNGEALAHETPGVRLLVLENAATAIPGAAVDEVGRGDACAVASRQTRICEQ